MAWCCQDNQFQFLDHISDEKSDNIKKIHQSWFDHKHAENSAVKLQAGWPLIKSSFVLAVQDVPINQKYILSQKSHDNILAAISISTAAVSTVLLLATTTDL